MLSREQIQNAQDFKKESVEVPEWGGTVYIRTMTAGHFDAYQIRAMESRGVDDALNPQAIRDARVILISYTLCDASGDLLFDDEEGIEILRQKDGLVIDRLSEKAMAINGLSEAAIEDAKKNLDSTLQDDSSIGSALPSDGALVNSTSE